jgi:uncharacterized membrane protein
MNLGRLLLLIGSLQFIIAMLVAEQQIFISFITVFIQLVIAALGQVLPGVNFYTVFMGVAWGFRWSLKTSR